MQSTGSQVFIQEEMEERDKNILSDILLPDPYQEEDPLEK